MYMYVMHFKHIQPHNLTVGRDLAVISKSRQKAVGSAPHDGLWRQHITRFRWWLYSSICLTPEVGRQDTAPTVPVNKGRPCCHQSDTPANWSCRQTQYSVSTALVTVWNSNDMVVDGEDDTCVSNSMLEIWHNWKRITKTWFLASGIPVGTSQPPQRLGRRSGG